MSNVPTSGNLTASIPLPGPQEAIEILLDLPGARIERIVSHGHASPEGFWYDQEDDEWVAVIEGEAELQIESEPEPRHLQRGEWIFLPAYCRHRVVRTATDVPTVWLALHVHR